jgi:hypothetical protein
LAILRENLLQTLGETELKNFVIREHLSCRSERFINALSFRDPLYTSWLDKGSSVFVREFGWRMKTNA